MRLFLIKKITKTTRRKKRNKYYIYPRIEFEGIGLDEMGWKVGEEIKINISEDKISIGKYKRKGILWKRLKNLSNYLKQT